MRKYQIWIFLLVNGLLSVIAKDFIMDKTLKLDKHKSAIYLLNKIGSKEGAVHMFEKINGIIGAYALIHYNKNDVVAKSAKVMLERAIRSKFSGILASLGAKADIDWKNVLLEELMKIEFMARSQDQDVELTISIVIVDKYKVTEVESIPKHAAEHREVLMHNLNKRFIMIETGLSLDQDQLVRAYNKLENVAIWKGAAKMIVDLAKISDTNMDKAKGIIIIDVDRVHPVPIKKAVFTPPEKNTFSCPRIAMGTSFLVDETLELDSHRSVIYLSNKIESKEGVIHMFEKINEKIGAYALIHYNQNDAVAKSARNMLETAIRSEVEGNGVRANSDWKSFLEAELINIENMGKKMDTNVELTIAIVIVDKYEFTKVESIPKHAVRRHTEVVMNNSNESFIMIETGLSLDQDQLARAYNILENLTIWKGAAKMIIDLAKISDTNVDKAKGIIIIDIDGVHRSINEKMPGFRNKTLSHQKAVVDPRFETMPWTSSANTVFENTLKLNGHKAEIYISRENDSNYVSDKRIVYLFKKFTESIGAYGLFDYNCDCDLALDIKCMFENDIQSNIAENGEAKIKWKSFLKRIFLKMEKIVEKKLSKEQAKAELRIMVTVVDKDTATQAKLIPKIPIFGICSKVISKIKAKSIKTSVVVFSSKDTKFLFMSTGSSLTPDLEQREQAKLENGREWKDAAKDLVVFGKRCDKKAEKISGAIVIELGYRKG